MMIFKLNKIVFKDFSEHRYTYVVLTYQEVPLIEFTTYMFSIEIEFLKYLLFFSKYFEMIKRYFYLFNIIITFF